MRTDEMRTWIFAAVTALFAVSPAVGASQTMPNGASGSEQSPAATGEASMSPALERFLRSRMERFIACSPYEPYRQAVDGAVLDFARRLSMPQPEAEQRLRDSAAEASGSDDVRQAHFERCGELGGVWGLAP